MVLKSPSDIAAVKINNNSSTVANAEIPDSEAESMRKVCLYQSITILAWASPSVAIYQQKKKCFCC